MKNITLFLFAALLVLGCQEECPPLGEPFTTLEGIAGTWTLNAVKQVDEPETDPTEREMELTSLFMPGAAATINFDNQAFTYKYTPNSARSYFVEDGTWAFDDNDYPTKIILNGGDETLDLLAPAREVDTSLEFLHRRGKSTDCQDVGTATLNELENFMSYEYTFTRNN